MPGDNMNKPEPHSKTPEKKDSFDNGGGDAIPTLYNTNRLETAPERYNLHQQQSETGEKLSPQQALHPPHPHHMLLTRYQNEVPKRAVVSPLTRNETSVSQPLRASGPPYFQTMSCPGTNGAGHGSNGVQYSDGEDDNIPSDIESCADEAELQEEEENRQKFPDSLTYSEEKVAATSIMNQQHQLTSPVRRQQVTAPSTTLSPAASSATLLPTALSPSLNQNKAGDNGMSQADDANEKDDEEDDTKDKRCSELANSSSSSSSSSRSGVKLQALETTNVAVAQVVESDPTASRNVSSDISNTGENITNTSPTASSLPNLQQVLYTLHQQQMFQLQVLQQLQHQVTKLASTDDEEGTNGTLKQSTAAAAAAAAAMFGMPWLGRGLVGSLQQPPQRNDDSCGLDDISETSLISNDTQEEQALEGKGHILIKLMLV